MQVQPPLPRTAMQPYTIALQSPYCLPYTALAHHATANELKRKRFTGVNVKAVSFKDGTLMLEATGDAIYVIRIVVKPYCITVQCDCDREVEKLCHHACKSLEWLALTQGDYYFERFAEDGELVFSAAYPEWFKQKNKQPLHVVLKEEGACLYKAASEKADKLKRLLKPWYPAVMQYKTEVPADVVTGYCICCSVRNLHPPILLPFWARLNNTGRAIKQFIGFFHKIEDLPALHFTHEQYVLNAIAAEMLQLAELLPGNEEDQHHPAIASVFHLWQKALPLLAKEKFLYGIEWSHYRRLPVKPPKQDMMTACFCTQPLQPHVHVKKVKEVISTSIALHAAGKKIPATIHYSFLEMIYSNGCSCFYMHGSLRNALLWQLVKKKQKIWVFPPVREKAITSFLQPLCMYYPAVMDRSVYDASTVLVPEQKTVSLAMKGDWYVLSAFIVYNEGSKVNVFTKGKHWLAYKAEGMMLMIRDKDAEHALKELVLSFVPGMHYQEQDDVIVWHRNEFNDDKLMVLKAKLEKEGVQFDNLVMS